MSESCSIDSKGCNSIKADGSIDLEKHWCNAYTKVDIETLGWYEKESSPSIELIEKSGISTSARILSLGAGATTLVDSLVAKGFKNQIVNDISSCALGNIKARLGEKANTIEFITDDIVNPEFLQHIEQVDLWNDRAVLHFFTSKKDIKSYFDLMHSKVKQGGFVLLAEFNLQGAMKCSGLDVKRYDSKMLQKALGTDYKLKETFDYDYVMPSGDTRKYVYTLFQRQS